MKVTTLGIDLAKSIFRVHGVDDRGAVVLRRQLARKQLLSVLANLPPCLIGMEACAGAHYWARELKKLGHTVRLMSPQFVAPYRKSQKKRRQRCGCDLRSSRASFNAICAGQESSPARRTSSSSNSFSAHQMAHSVGQ